MTPGGRRAALLAAGLLLLAGCERADRPRGQSLRVAVIGEGGLARRMADELTAATLIERDAGGQLVAGLASSWRFVDDGQSLILRLAPRKWSDGRDLVSQDVVTSFRTAARPPRADPVFRAAGLAGADEVAAGRAANRLGVLAPISRVVELRLAAASPLLLEWLAEPSMSVRREGALIGAYVEVPSQPDATNPVLVLTRRSMTPQPEALAAEISIGTRPPSGVARALAELKVGRLDMVVSEGLAGLNDARIEARRNLLRVETLRGVYGWRVNARNGPLADPALRRALWASVDRASLVRGLGVPLLQPETGLRPMSLRQQPAAADLADADDRLAPGGAPEFAIEAARAEAGAAVLAARRRLAGDAGDTEPPPLLLRLLVPPGREHRQVAERVAADWRALGVTLQLREAGAAIRAALIARGEFDLALEEVSTAVPDPVAALDRFRCGAGPHCNVAADALLAAARTAPPEERPGRLAVVEQLLMEGPPFIPLFTAMRWAVMAPGIEGWVPNATGVHPLGRVSRRR